MKPCIACGAKIEKGATLCSVCKSHQSKWRNNLTFFSGLTALFVLIGSLATYVYSTVAQARKDMFWSRQVSIVKFDSSSGMTVLNSSDNPVYISHVELSRLVYDGGTTFEKTHYETIEETIEPHKFIYLSHPSSDAFPKKLASQFETTYQKDVTTEKLTQSYRLLTGLSDPELKFALQRYASEDSCIQMSLHTLNDPGYLSRKEGTDYVLPVKERQGNRLPVIRATTKITFVSAKDGKTYSPSFQLAGILRLSTHSSCNATGKAFEELRKRRHEPQE